MENGMDLFIRYTCVGIKHPLCFYVVESLPLGSKRNEAVNRMIMFQAM